MFVPTPASVMQSLKKVADARVTEVKKVAPPASEIPKKTENTGRRRIRPPKSSNLTYRPFESLSSLIGEEE